MQIVIRQSHRDRIYDLLIQRIRTGTVVWEDRLVDVALAAELGVSRMPARDALMRLVAEGYLVTTTRGFMLPRLTEQQILEVFELRRLLEPRAAALAAQYMTPPVLAAMAGAVSDGEGALQAGDGATLFRVSEVFRNAWLSVVPNYALVWAISRNFVQVQNVRLITMGDPETLQIIVAGQQRLLCALRARDAVGAADHMLRFVIEGEQAFHRATRAEV